MGRGGPGPILPQSRARGRVGWSDAIDWKTIPG